MQIYGNNTVNVYVHDISSQAQSVAYLSSPKNGHSIDIIRLYKHSLDFCKNKSLITLVSCEIWPEIFHSPLAHVNISPYLTLTRVIGERAKPHTNWSKWKIAIFICNRTSLKMRMRMK